MGPRRASDEVVGMLWTVVSLSEEMKEKLFSTASHTAVVLGFGSEAEAPARVVAL